MFKKLGVVFVIVAIIAGGSSMLVHDNNHGNSASFVPPTGNGPVADFVPPIGNTAEYLA